MKVTTYLDYFARVIVLTTLVTCCQFTLVNELLDAWNDELRSN